MAMRFASCQSARLRLRVSSHGLSKASLERELVIATVSGSTTPVEIRKIAQLASMYEWQCGRRSSAPAAMETVLAAHWKTSSRAAMCEDDACTLRANTNGLNPHELEANDVRVLFTPYGTRRHGRDAG